MDGLTVLMQAREAGLQILAEGDKLIIRGPRSAERFALAVLAHKPEVLALLASDAEEVRWRVAVMRPQVPRTGPIPRLLARPTTPAHATLRSCGSCGDPLDESRRYVCRFCQHAAWLVLMEVREDVSADTL